MKVKKLALLLLIATSTLLMSGCLNAVQLNERALVQAIGIDFEDDVIKLTLQVFSPSTGGGLNIDSASENAKIIEAEGATVSQAMQNATLIQGKQVFIGHCRVIIVGEQLAKSGLNQPLSFFSSNSDSPQNVNIMVAKEKANTILTSKINQGILPAETLEKMLLNSKENGMLEDVRLFEFLRASKSKQDAATLPIIQAVSDEASEAEAIDQVSSIKISGMAVFVESVMVGEMNDSQSRGLLWIRNKIKNTTVMTKSDKYEVAALKIYKAKTRLIPTIEEDDVSFKLVVDCRASLGETLLKKGASVSIKDIPALERSANAVIETECIDAFGQAVLGYKADIFDFGNIVWRENVDVWKTLREDWSNRLNKIKFDVECKVVVNRVGLEFNQQ